MIKTDTSIGIAFTIDDARGQGKLTAHGAHRPSGATDVVQISDECKKRLVMSKLRASLSTTGSHKGRYNR